MDSASPTLQSLGLETLSKNRVDDQLGNAYKENNSVWHYKWIVNGKLAGTEPLDSAAGVFFWEIRLIMSIYFLLISRGKYSIDVGMLSLKADYYLAKWKVYVFAKLPVYNKWIP